MSNVDDDDNNVERVIADYYIMHNILQEKTANNKDMFTQQLQIPSRSLLGNIKNGSSQQILGFISLSLLLRIIKKCSSSKMVNAEEMERVPASFFFFSFPTTVSFFYSSPQEARSPIPKIFF